MMTPYPSILVNNGRGGQIPFPPFITQQDLEVLARDFSLQDDDILVTTYPRSGTTWTEQIVHLLLNDGEQGEQRINDAVPWLETLPNRPPDMHTFLQAMPLPRRFTSHLPLSMMLGRETGKGRIIYVARNPKDVATSYYQHDRSKFGYEGSWDEHFAMFLQGELMFGSYFDHVLPWWQASQEDSNILFLKYEDMQRDLTSAVRQIGAFLDLQPDEDLVDRVVAGSSFKAMKSNPITNFDWMQQEAGVPKHFRKGVVGDWRSQLSAEQNQQLDALYAERMAGSGLAFEFGDS